ncbi:MAG: carbohydrate ABC transporter permease [Caldilineaceae bacterium]|jgi:multiple sugar transport system permease protein
MAAEPGASVTEEPIIAANAPRQQIDYSVRVDKVGGRTQAVRTVRILLITAIAVIMLIPVYWMGATAFKSRADVIAIPPKALFTPKLEGFVNLLTDRAVLNKVRLERLREQEDLSLFERIAIDNGQVITGPSPYVSRLRNSIIIAGTSTILAVFLGFLAAYAFSRFNVAGENDLLFFILSTRMLPAVVVTIPIFIMYKSIGLHDTHLGLILLYTIFNLSLTVWLLKGFMDEIPREYEEAAMVDGYTRLQGMRKVVLPQAVTGIAATAVFALIFAWNEYAFALMLTTERARTAPPSIPSILGRGGIEWSAIAAGTLGFLIPVVIVTFALRKYLLRGVTFGAIRQ